MGYLSGGGGGQLRGQGGGVRGARGRTRPGEGGRGGI